jgi:FkbM family methyltransferase
MMSFISYAQNLEDVMLYRALKHVECGFYIDVGAQHPVIDSVTKAFYDRGWRGINVEPVSRYYQLLVKNRPRDININLLVGEKEGELDFYEFPETGLSTVSKAYAERNSKEGFEVSTHISKCNTLDTICRQQGVSIVHFLKIDVEGAEKEVLKGFSFDEVRPWILVIEATTPLSTQDVSHEWEPLVLSMDYEFVYFDGVNRFYLSIEHNDLKCHFQAPPNFFDDYIHSNENIALDQANNRIKELESHIKELESHIKELENHLDLIQKSMSWRMTAPLRKGKDLLVSPGLRLIKDLIKPILRLLFHFGLLVRIGSWILKNQPGLRAKLGSVRTQPSFRATRTKKNATEPVASLPESARSIYSTLKDAYNKKNKESKK